MGADNRTEVINNLFSAVWRNVKTNIIDQVFEITPFWMMLKQNGRLKESTAGGRAIDCTVQYDKITTVEGFTKGSTFSLSEDEFLTQASWDWKYIGASLVRYWTDEQKVRGKAKLLDYVNAKVANLKGCIADHMEEKAFGAQGGSSTLEINGLDYLIAEDPTSGTIGNIDRSENTWWRNQYKDFTGLSYAGNLLAEMTTMWNNCSKYKDQPDDGEPRHTPDLIVTTQTIHEQYESLCRALGYIEKTANAQVADLGYGDLAFKGVPIVWSPDCKAGSMYFINTKHLTLQYDPFAFFDMTEWKKVPNGLDMTAQCAAVCQLTVDNMRKHGVIFNIGE